MTSICPVCNGLQLLNIQCPVCHRDATDCGRFNDFLGPYAPYRDIDDISMTNGYCDVSNRLCIHLISCTDCHRTFTVQVEPIN